MNKKINILLGIMVIVTLSIMTKAQTLTGFPVTGVVVAGSVTVIKGVPYSAETASETVKTLADGNRITNVFKQKVYRDSEGRVRTEQLPPEPSLSPEFLSLRETITITDPVAGFGYYLNPSAKTFRRLPLTTKNTISITPIGPIVEAKQPDTTSPEIKVIEGVKCTMTKNTSLIPAGKIGNEREIITTYQSCYSDDLKISMFSQNDDPQFGVRTYKVTNLLRNEPDKSLFSVPADYKMVNGGAVSVTGSAEKNNP